MLWWREVSCLSVHLSDTTGNELRFLRRQGLTNADLMLVSVLLSAFSDCVHVNLGVDVRADMKTCRRLLVADNSPLTWCCVRNTPGSPGATARYAFLCVTCMMKAKEELLFLGRYQ